MDKLILSLVSKYMTHIGQITKHLSNRFCRGFNDIDCRIVGNINRYIFHELDWKFQIDQYTSNDFCRTFQVARHNSNEYCFLISFMPILLCGDIYLSCLSLRLNNLIDMEFKRICLNNSMNAFYYNILCDLEIDILTNNKVDSFYIANNDFVGRQLIVFRCQLMLQRALSFPPLSPTIKV